MKSKGCSMRNFQMKHPTLSTLLLIGFGLTPALGLLGGGNIHYGAEIQQPELEQSSDNTGDTSTEKTASDANEQEATLNYETKLCVGDGRTCSGRDDEQSEEK